MGCVGVFLYYATTEQRRWENEYEIILPCGKEASLSVCSFSLIIGKVYGGISRE